MDDLRGMGCVDRGVATRRDDQHDGEHGPRGGAGGTDAGGREDAEHQPKPDAHRKTDPGDVEATERGKSGVEQGPTNALP